MSNYRYPEVLITAEWLSKNMGAAKVLLIEVDINTTAYHKGHIENAVGWKWQSQLQNNVRRDLPVQHEFEELCVQSGVPSDSTGDLCGDHENWFVLKYLEGSENVSNYDGS